MSRVRSSKGRDRNFRNTHSAIVLHWRRGIRQRDPMNEFKASQGLIEQADVTVTDRARLQAAHWALREYCDVTHSRWQLYLDGKPTTSNEVSDKRAAGDENVWQRACGRHEWDDTHEPFYANEPPASLHTPPTTEVVQ